MLAPATGFYATKGNGNQEVRIAYVLNKESLQNAVECLAKALEEYPGKVVSLTSVETQSNITG